jgi:hypothetical protein
MMIKYISILILLLFSFELVHGYEEFRFELPMLQKGCYKRLVYSNTKCAMLVGFKYPIACEGTVCKYLHGGPQYIMDEGIVANVIPVYGGNKPIPGMDENYIGGRDHIKAFSGDLLDRVSGRATYRYGGPSGKVTFEFKNAPVIRVRRIEMRTRDECKCQVQGSK